MRARILVAPIVLLITFPSFADWDPHSCDRMVQVNRYYESRLVNGLPSYGQHAEIDISSNASLPDLDRGFLVALNVYIRESNNGAISAVVRHAGLAMLKRLADQPRWSELYVKWLAELESRAQFGTGVERAFTGLAIKRHKPSLRCLGHIYRYGIGVEIDLTKAWGFYDTYNLVAGIDGIDEFRTSVSKIMTGEQILEGQGLARIYRDLYTDAWKVPSMIIIQ